MDRAEQRRLPDPVDPAPGPRPLLVAAAFVVLGGVVLALLGRGEPAAWAIGGLLLGAYGLVRHLRIRRADRTTGFLPRAGRRTLPADGRETLYRVERGVLAGRVCLMLVRWEHYPPRGWRRDGVVEHAWVEAGDAAEQQARLEAAARALEERADARRLRYRRLEALADEALADGGGRSGRRFARGLAGDGS